MIKIQVLNHLPRASEGKKKRSYGDVRREAMKKGRSARVSAGKKIRKDDSFEYFLPKGVRSTF